MAILNGLTINDTGFLNIPRGTNAQRPTDPASGTVRLNTTHAQLEVYLINKWYDMETGFPSRDLGTSASVAAESADAIISANPEAEDGIYWIDLPIVGPTQIYCMMNREFGQEGGYMLALKATRGTTFNYDSSYWTAPAILNETSQLNRNDADAKFHVFNYFAASKFLAFFPDLNNGGQTSGAGSGWHWLLTSQNQTGLARFQATENISNSPQNETMYVGSGFSRQDGYRRYGINYIEGGGVNSVRWGFGWNNETDFGSNDVSGGIGMSSKFENFSAGDHINCCETITGVDRSARVEIWVK